MADSLDSSHIQLNRLWVSGFKANPQTLLGGRGIALIAKNGFTTRNLRVDSNWAFKNEYAGIQAWAEGSGRHQNLSVSRNLSFENLGLRGVFLHSGSGIIVSQAQDVLIEGNEAFRNGYENTAMGGPVGIWAWDSTRVLIRRNYSYENRTSSGADGGGFDFDGGVTDSVMEENISFANDGPGYLLCTYEGSDPIRRIIIRNNVSINDAQKNHYRPISFFGDVDDVIIQGNIVHYARENDFVMRALNGESSVFKIIDNIHHREIDAEKDLMRQYL